MKYFLKKTFLFSIGLIFFFGINAFINYTIIKYTNPIFEKSGVLIIGDSHLQKALNPELMNNAQNIAQGDEPYILSFWKLKKFIEIARPDTLIIGFSPHNISAQNDLKFCKKKWSSEMFKRSYTIENFNTIKNIEIDYNEYYKVLLKQIGFYPKRDHYHYIGGYSNSDFNNISNANSVFERHYYFDQKFLGVSNSSISHLDSIIKECNSHNIIPILVSSPVHESYYHRIPSKIKFEYEELKRSLNLRGIHIIDKTANFYSDSLYFDSDHLNAKGAEKFSLELGKNINQLKNEKK